MNQVLRFTYEQLNFSIYEGSVKVTGAIVVVH